MTPILSPIVVSRSLGRRDERISAGCALARVDSASSSSAQYSSVHGEDGSVKVDAEASVSKWDQGVMVAGVRADARRRVRRSKEADRARNTARYERESIG